MKNEKTNVSIHDLKEAMSVRASQELFMRKKEHLTEENSASAMWRSFITGRTSSAGN